jgi:hypothetical protein
MSFINNESNRCMQEAHMNPEFCHNIIISVVNVSYKLVKKLQTLKKYKGVAIVKTMKECEVV